MESTSRKRSREKLSARYGPSLDTGVSDHEQEILEHGRKLSVYSDRKKQSFQDLEDDYRGRGEERYYENERFLDHRGKSHQTNK